MNSGFKGWSWLACLLVWGGVLHAQGYSGQIKNDKAFIIVSSGGYKTVEELAKAWAVPADQILTENPALASGTIPGTTEVLIPVGMIIKTSACDSCKPVYHNVAKSEGLYRIGKCYGNTSTATLKKMNRLRSDALDLGQQLLVGYIAPQTLNFVEHEPAQAAIIADTALPVEVNPERTEPVKEPVPTNPGPELLYQGNGLFEAEYVIEPGNVSQKAGKAASFKTESGWKDGRFYLLNSQLKTGVVVKVIHPVSGKIIFAKVVGPLPKIKQNDKLDWRLSSAAAATLGFWNDGEIMDLILEY